jgi:adenylate cyclase class IV
VILIKIHLTHKLLRLRNNKINWMNKKISFKKMNNNNINLILNISQIKKAIKHNKFNKIEKVKKIRILYRVIQK